MLAIHPHVHKVRMKSMPNEIPVRLCAQCCESKSTPLPTKRTPYSEALDNQEYQSSGEGEQNNGCQSRSSKFELVPPCG
ncbi:hypothetical protein EAH_00024120 [Eimeria acervulina]|uniref:Uncharacterized protein n=1 Tax=Eimeria acervulina TaxID=5801 RepID=U6GTH4_EIMAC|nr:hypothetical protein EAH_00024120 [Eimeria acervulina]CDI81899.1 hypothetical protein EAH_00024120 [Eimeria acervulina]